MLEVQQNSCKNCLYTAVPQDIHVHQIIFSPNFIDFEAAMTLTMLFPLSLNLNIYIYVSRIFSMCRYFFFYRPSDVQKNYADFIYKYWNIYVI